MDIYTVYAGLPAGAPYNFALYAKRIWRVGLPQISIDSVYAQFPDSYIAKRCIL